MLRVNNITIPKGRFTTKKSFESFMRINHVNADYSQLWQEYKKL